MPEPWSSAAGWREFFDLLSDAVVVLDFQARVVLANTAALRMLPCEAGTPIEQLQGALGAPAVRWLKRAATGRLENTTPPAASLMDGRTAALEWRRLDARHSAIRLVPVQVPARASGAVASARSLSVAADGMRETIGFLWDSPFPTLLQGADFRLVDVNQAFVDFVGHARERVVGRDVLEFQPQEDWPFILAARDRVRLSPQSPSEPAMVEGRLIDASGRERRYRVSRRAVIDEGGQTLYLAVLQDVTAEHVARERADRSLRELDDWFDLSPVGMVLFDEGGLLVRTNPAFDTLSGTVPVSLADEPTGLRELLGWGETQVLPGLEPDSHPEQRQGWVTSPGGSARLLRAVVRCFLTVGGQRRYMAVVEDRSAEEERDLAQMQIGALMDTAGVGLATFQESSGWVRQDPTGRSGVLGARGGSAALQSIGRDIVLPESIAEFERLQAALRHAQRAEVRYAIRHPELGQRWLLTRVEPATLASGKQTTSVVTLDITEQHETQRRTEQLLHELSTILESTTAGIAYLRGNVLVRCNRRFEAMIGSRGVVPGCSVRELFAGHEQTERIAADAWQALREGTTYETEFDVRVRRAGREETRWYSLSVRRTGPLSGTLEVIAVLSDVTRLKAQQHELEVLARDRELMFSLSGVGIAFVRDGRIQRANQALAQLAGYSAEELATLSVADLFKDAAEFERGWPLQENSLRDKGHWSGERQMRVRDGRLLWVQVSKRLVNRGDPSGGIIASYVNVDARHRAERAVSMQAERTRSILDSVLVGIVTVGPLGIEWMNRSARRMFAGELKDFVNQPIWTVATDQSDHPLRRTNYLSDLVEGQAETFECRLKARDGRQFWVVGNVVFTARDASGGQLTFALLDIERRREAEERVSQAQSQLQRIIEAAPLAITLRDAKTLKILQINEVAAKNAQRPREALIGLAPEGAFDPDTAQQRRSDMEQALSSSEVTKREYHIETDGEVRVWDARYLPLSASPHHAPDQLLMVATDVTEQRAAQEARYEAAVMQRDMLVKEVHHRIKNNLQGVAGLLQQIAQRKPEVAGPISEVVSQVQAIAQVYGLQVGESGPLQLISVVRAITGSVQRTFGRPIRFVVAGRTAADWMLPEAESIPIALTLNELLTNAVKHATRSSVALPDGEVGCTLNCTEDSVQVTIVNPGRLPAGFNLGRIPGGVSGLGLVRALLPRRSAALALEQRAGDVVATIALRSPGVARSAALDANAQPAAIPGG